MKFHRLIIFLLSLEWLKIRDELQTLLLRIYKKLSIFLTWFLNRKDWNKLKILLNLICIKNKLIVLPVNLFQQSHPIHQVQLQMLQPKQIFKSNKHNKLILKFLKKKKNLIKLKLFQQILELKNENCIFHKEFIDKSSVNI